MMLIGFTLKQQEARDVLLEPGVTTYFLGARRLGITENAFGKRITASYMQVVKARQVIKADEDWRKARKLAKQGKYKPEEI